MDWYYKKGVGQERIGPLSDEAIRAMAERGDIKPDVLLWHAGMADWTAARDIPGVITPPNTRVGPPPAPPATWVPSTRTKGPADHDGVAADEAAVPVAGPWARFWARSLDMALSVSLLGFVIGAIFPSIAEPGSALEGQQGDLILGLALLPLSMVVDAGIHTIFGNTLGKWIAGLRVLSSDGRKLPFKDYLWRNLGVYVQGYGLGLPLVSLVTLIYSWNKARKGEDLGWDASKNRACFGINTSLVRNFVTAFIWIALIFGLNALGSIEAYQSYQ